MSPSTSRALTRVANSWCRSCGWYASTEASRSCVGRRGDRTPWRGPPGIPQTRGAAGRAGTVAGMRTEARQRAHAAVVRLAGAGTGVVELLDGAVEALRGALPVDGWCGLVLDPANAVKTASVHRASLPSELAQRALDLEYRHDDVNQFADLARARRPVAVLSGAGDGLPQRSARYRTSSSPPATGTSCGWSCASGAGRGVASCSCGSARSAPFIEADLTFLAGLSALLARGVHRALLRADPGADPADPPAGDAGVLPHHPGLLLLDADHRIESITPGTRRLLAGVIDEPRGAADLPVALRAVASNVAAATSGAAVRARIPTRYGGWLTVYGWRLGDEPVRLALSIERSRAEALAGLVLDGYGLSPRERQVTDRLVAGHATAEIARSLYLSPHTVRDHVKAIFAKTGVSSRRQLVADIYLRQYLPRLERGSAPDR